MKIVFVLFLITLYALLDLTAKDEKKDPQF
ncbi:hypothetical protein JOC73_001709 [Alkaliphilus hydrothermalis]|uniref:Uncharacterized protein n=1 Tax=Alkaliphilus hydrothermalis TaxID=1482730 RepID=A0ABS2NQI0_9FIRM|nr:hypothetical protein [Alkaliphilus hydrothermalis]